LVIVFVYEKFVEFTPGYRLLLDPVFLWRIILRVVAIRALRPTAVNGILAIDFAQVKETL
jgi:hypothetical protein